jgi:hypothetical protein
MPKPQVAVLRPDDITCYRRSVRWDTIHVTKDSGSFLRDRRGGRQCGGTQTGVEETIIGAIGTLTERAIRDTGLKADIKPELVFRAINQTYCSVNCRYLTDV